MLRDSALYKSTTDTDVDNVQVEIQQPKVKTVIVASIILGLHYSQVNYHVKRLALFHVAAKGWISVQQCKFKKLKSTKTKPTTKNEI